LKKFDEKILGVKILVKKIHDVFFPGSQKNFDVKIHAVKIRDEKIHVLKILGKKIRIVKFLP